MNQEDIKKLNIPETPGCYQYFDKDEQLLYIGKAANLKKRVSSYWRESAKHTGAKQAMVSKISSIKWIEVGSEIEALLLEANLIKKHQPPYNIVLRDDKRHIYIKVSDDEFPRIVATRNIDKSGRYFGPFISALAVRETLKIISRAWPFGKFITLPSNKANLQRSQRYPELYGAPTDRDEYLKIIREIEAFLEGRRKEVEKEAEARIKNYELQITKTSNEQELGEIKEKIAREKYYLINMRKILAHSNILSVHDKYAADVVEMAKILNLPKVPQRIEGYDISNIFGQEAVGSMIVFANGEPDKKEYRKFKIKSMVTDPHSSAGDTIMLKEILKRRFDNDWPLPDLIIIDGGKGQLNAGISVLKKFKLDIPILAVSKGEGLRSAIAPDKIFFPGQKQPLKLPLSSPALHIIKRVRDEAHRFAIGFHRERKIKRMLEQK